MPQRAGFQLQDPKIEINNIPIPFRSNTLVVNTGKGESMVTAYSQGGGAVLTITSTNTDTKKGTIKFNVPTTVAPFNAVQSYNAWKEFNEFNVIEFIDPSITMVFGFMTLTSNVDFNVFQEGEGELQFEGPPPQVILYHT